MNYRKYILDSKVIEIPKAFEEKAEEYTSTAGSNRGLNLEFNPNAMHQILVEGPTDGMKIITATPKKVEGAA